MTVEERMNALTGENMNIMTRGQLADAIRRMDRNREKPIKFGEYWSAETLASDLFAHRSERTTHNSYVPAYSGGNVPVNNPNETLTVAELDKALRDLGHVTTEANNLYRQVVANREPKWETGNIVRSNAGNVFTRLANGDWRNESAPNIVVKDGNIGRPLTLIGQAL